MPASLALIVLAISAAVTRPGGVTDSLDAALSELEHETEKRVVQSDLERTDEAAATPVGPSRTGSIRIPDPMGATIERAVEDQLAKQGYERSKASTVAWHVTQAVRPYLDSTERSLERADNVEKAEYGDGDKDAAPPHREEAPAHPQFKTRRNIGYLEQGYNHIYANPMPQTLGLDPGYSSHAGKKIFEISYSTDRRPGDGMFAIPDNVRADSLDACAVDFSTTEVSTSIEYKEMLDKKTSFSAGVSMAFYGSAKYSGSEEQKEHSESTFDTSSTELYTSVECHVYKAQLAADGCLPNFSPEFKDAVAQISAAGDGSGNVTSAELEAMYDLLDSYGTSYFSALTMGARFTSRTTVDTKEYKTLKKSEYGKTVSAEIEKENLVEKCNLDCKLLEGAVDMGLEGAKKAATGGLGLERLSPFLGAGATASVNRETKAKSEARQNFKSMSKSKLSITIGEPPVADEIAWAKTVGDKPMPVDQSIVPICELFGRPKRGESCGSGRYAAGKHVRKVCDKAMTTSGYCAGRVQWRDPTINCEVKALKPLPHCSSNQNCKEGAKCVKGVCKQTYKRITDVRMAVVRTDNASDLKKFAQHPCAPEYLVDTFPDVHLVGAGEQVAAVALMKKKYKGYKPVAVQGAAKAGKDYFGGADFHFDVDKRKLGTQECNTEFHKKRVCATTDKEWKHAKGWFCVKKEGEGKGKGVCQMALFGADKWQNELTCDEAFVLPGIKYSHSGAPENAPSQNQPFLQATPETLPDARSYFGAFAKTHEKKVGTDKHCPTRACWFPKYTPKYETQYLPKKKDGKYEGAFAVGALAFDAQVDGDEMQPKGQQHALCLSRLGCEEYHEQYTCKSFTPFMCLDELRRTSVAPGKMGETDVRDCTVVDEKGKPEAGEAGYCTCSDKEGANIMLGVRGCGGYSETTCKARCAGLDLGAPIDDLIAVVAPAELVCPKGYQEVPQASERDAGMTTPRMAKYLFCMRYSANKA